MAFDGSTIHCIVDELNQTLLSKKISKIAQPEKEELLITFKGDSETVRLLMSANASLPFLYLTTENKVSPSVAPNFCMVLRKYIGNGRIVEIKQMDFERVIRFKIEHLDELRDLAYKYLYIEIMGKHSNIIFCNEQDVIIDSIKHISAQVSSIREVLPGRTYFIPSQENKLNPLEVNETHFQTQVFSKPLSLYQAIFQSFVGISPMIAMELCYRVQLDADASCQSLTTKQQNDLWEQFAQFIEQIKSHQYHCQIILDEKGLSPQQYAVFSLTHFQDHPSISYDSISQLLSDYYAKKNQFQNIHQKSSDLRKIILLLLDRNRKKQLLQEKQLEDTNKMEQYKIYGELLHIYAYLAKEGDKFIEVENYYTNEQLRIPLDVRYSAIDNATRYFNKYTKYKRTKEALCVHLLETQHTIEHLESIENVLSLAQDANDLAVIRQEMFEFGYIKKQFSSKNGKAKHTKIAKTRPLHYVTASGFHIYVGKNNYQNDEITFKMATGNDWWFHAKKIPGSHVLVKTEGNELPDDVFVIAAQLAGYYSSGKENEKLEVDYLQKKNVKKPAGALPGFVVYYTNFSMMVHPQITDVTLREDS